MSVRATLVLGFFILLAALVHGGVYAPGHDFVVNRFTGAFVFVPSQEQDWGDGGDLEDTGRRALTSRVPPDRVGGLYCRR